MVSGSRSLTQDGHSGRSSARCASNVLAHPSARTTYRTWRAFPSPRRWRHTWRRSRTVLHTQDICHRVKRQSSSQGGCHSTFASMWSLMTPKTYSVPCIWHAPTNAGTPRHSLPCLASSGVAHRERHLVLPPFLLHPGRPRQHVRRLRRPRPRLSSDSLRRRWQSDGSKASAIIVMNHMSGDRSAPGCSSWRFLIILSRNRMTTLKSLLHRLQIPRSTLTSR